MLEHLFAGARKLRGREFRKRIGIFSYKIKGNGASHKKPGMMDLQTKQTLLAEKTIEAAKKISEIESKSIFPFGKWNQHGFLIRKILFRSKKSTRLPNSRFKGF